jgi:hypothetical protein
MGDLSPISSVLRLAILTLKIVKNEGGTLEHAEEKPLLLMQSVLFGMHRIFLLLESVASPPRSSLHSWNSASRPTHAIVNSCWGLRRSSQGTGYHCRLFVGLGRTCGSNLAWAGAAGQQCALLMTPNALQLLSMRSQSSESAERLLKPLFIYLAQTEL